MGAQPVSQAAWFSAQPHLPSMQRNVSPQATPQAPQFRPLVNKSTQTPSQTFPSSQVGGSGLFPAPAPPSSSRGFWLLVPQATTSVPSVSAALRNFGRGQALEGTMDFGIHE